MPAIRRRRRGRRCMLLHCGGDRRCLGLGRCRLCDACSCCGGLGRLIARLLCGCSVEVHQGRVQHNLQQRLAARGATAPGRARRAAGHRRGGRGGGAAGRAGGARRRRHAALGRQRQRSSTLRHRWGGSGLRSSSSVNCRRCCQSCGCWRLLRIGSRRGFGLLCILARCVCHLGTRGRRGSSCGRRRRGRGRSRRRLRRCLHSNWRRRFRDSLVRRNSRLKSCRDRLRVNDRGRSSFSDRRMHRLWCHSSENHRNGRRRFRKRCISRLALNTSRCDGRLCLSSKRSLGSCGRVSSRLRCGLGCCSARQRGCV